jgi:catechol 2,3-dioxygenase
MILPTSGCWRGPKVGYRLYLRDPDGNGVELYWDRTQEQWPRTADGGIAMFTRPLDLDGLAEEAKTRTTL